MLLSNYDTENWRDNGFLQLILLKYATQITEMLAYYVILPWRVER